MNQIFFNFLGLFGLCISAGIGLWIEFVFGQIPCVLCYLQRAAMLMIATGLYWNISSGVSARNYACSFIGCLFGWTAVLRHMALNACRPPPPGAFFFWSYRIYSWSFLVFFCSFLSLSLLLFFYKPEKACSSVFWKRVSGGTLLLVLIGTTISALIRRGCRF
jgi:disulfide bond formation protein DsbB